MFLGVGLGSLVLVGVMVWGLTKMGGEQGGLNVEVEKLVDGAGWIKETCSTSEQTPSGSVSDEKHCDYKVTVVEFSCLQCPACKQSKYVYEELKSMEGVRYVFRHLPLLAIHKNAWVAAKAAVAAKEMGKGWEMMDLLFEKQEDWAESNDFDEKVIEYVKELGLDEVEFIAFYKGENIENQIVLDNALVAELKLGGTPTFFVEGEQVAASFVLTKVNEILENK